MKRQLEAEKSRNGVVDRRARDAAIAAKNVALAEVSRLERERAIALAAIPVEPAKLTPAQAVRLAAVTPPAKPYESNAEALKKAREDETWLIRQYHGLGDRNLAD